MCSAMVSISLPERLFQRLKRVADLTHRSVEEVAATSLEVALPADQNLPVELADELAAMRLCSDDATIFADEDVAGRVRELTRGEGADVVIDVTAQTMEPIVQAVDLARTGGTIIPAGVT